MSEMISDFSIRPVGNSGMSAFPELEWSGGECQWLLEIGHPSRKIFLPGELIRVDRQKIQAMSDILILSERSGGARSLLAWWCRLLDARQEAWIHVEANAWLKHLFATHRGWGVGEEDLDVVAGIGLSTDRLKIVEDLSQWASGLTRPFTLFLRDLPAMGERALLIASALRSFREYFPTTQLRIVLVSHQEEVVDSVYYQSGYFPLLWQLKTRGFLDKEIRVLAQAWSERMELAAANREVLVQVDGVQVLKETGGQPLLVQNLLEIISRTEKGEVAADSRGAVARAADLLKKDPPDACWSWMEELGKILRVDKRLSEKLHSYVRGDTLGPARFPPSAFERPLFVAGWLGTEPLFGRWGIRSIIHSSLARQVLDRL